MRVAVTGTPGTGKTTATDLLADEPDVDVVHLNRVVDSEELYDSVDEERDSVVADLDALGDWVDEYEAGMYEAEMDGADRDDVKTLVLDSHLSHHLDVDRVVVLRCTPKVLERRLLERGESETKAGENAESEALDVVLSEAVDRHGFDAVYEIETTDRTPEDVAADVRAVVDGKREPSAGTVNYLDYL